MNASTIRSAIDNVKQIDVGAFKNDIAVLIDAASRYLSMIGDSNDFDLSLRHPDGSLWNFMLRDNGKPFRCECGCNVFHKPDRNRLSVYKCNSCGDVYEAEQYLVELK